MIRLLADGSIATGSLCVRRRYEADIRSLNSAIRSARLTSGVQSRLVGHLHTVELDLLGKSWTDIGRFRTCLLPLGKGHERLFELQAELWRASGYPAFSAWAPPAWDPLPLVAAPSPPGGEIDVHLMRGEYRAAAINFAHCGAATLRVALKLTDDDPHSAVLRNAVRLHDVLWTDTSQGEPVAAALPELVPGKEGYVVSKIPGMIHQV